MLFRRKAPARYLGYVDSVRDGWVWGWLVDAAAPTRSLEVEIFSAGHVIGRVRAQDLRSDIAAAGLGDGRCGFSFQAPPGTAEETLAVRPVGDALWLPVSDRSAILGGACAQLADTPRQGLALLNPVLAQRFPDAEDEAIAADLLRDWRAAFSYGGGRLAPSSGPSMWREIVRRLHGGLLARLEKGDARALAHYLVGVQKAPESHGVVQGAQAYADFLASDPQGRRAAIVPFHDMLASLVQYLALVPADCAEQNYEGVTLALASNALVERVSSHLGFDIVPPPVFDGLYGMGIAACGLKKPAWTGAGVSGGVLHGRDIQSLYAALRAFEESAGATPDICEIGGGFGQVAYYALALGARRYTIIDLPTVCALQYFYLRRCGAQVRIVVDPQQLTSPFKGVTLIFAQSPAVDRMTCDLALNCDSFPEMGEAICRTYFKTLAGTCRALLSINQEGAQPMGDERQTIVGAFLPQYGFKRRLRFRSWVRRGFIEEVWRAPSRTEDAKTP